jgi:hypothetical protein
VSDRDLSGEADQDIEAGADDGRERHQRQQERRIAFAQDRSGEPGGGERKDRARHGEGVSQPEPWSNHDRTSCRCQRIR